MPLAEWDTSTTGKTGQETELWIDVIERKVVVDGNQVSTGELRQYVAQWEQFSPRPYLKLDLTRAADCAVATKVRDMIASGFPCGKANCWQGSREAFERAAINPSKPIHPW